MASILDSPSFDIGNLWNSLASNVTSAPLDNSYVPVSSASVAPATTSSTSWWQSLTSGISSLASGAAPLVGAITGKSTSTPTPTSTANSASSILSSPLVLLGLIGGGLLVVFMLLKRK